MAYWTEDRLIKWQAGSGAVFGSFLSLHLANAVCANMGYETYNRVLGIFRLYYQNRLTEPILLGSGLVHMTISAIRFNRRQQMNATLQKHANDDYTRPEKTNEPLTSFSKFVSTLSPLRLHRYAGLYLQVVIIGHVAATRLPYVLYGKLADFSLVAWSLKMWPFAFYPYYILLGSCGLYHLSFGIQQAAKVFDIKLPKAISPKKKLFWVGIGVGAVALISAVLAFGGAYFEIPKERFVEHRRLYDAVCPTALRTILLPWAK